MKVKYLKKIVLYLLLFISQHSEAQITFGDKIVKKTEIENLKKLDTTIDIFHGNEISFPDYKIYIGYDFFLPPYDNDESFYGNQSKQPTFFNDRFVAKEFIIDLPIARLKKMTLISKKMTLISNFAFPHFPPNLGEKIFDDKPTEIQEIPSSDADSISNVYYKLINVYYRADALNIIKQQFDSLKMLGNYKSQLPTSFFNLQNLTCKYFGMDACDCDFKDYNSDNALIFLLKSKVTGELIYSNYENFSHFIFVPYFNYLKKTYDNKIFICKPYEDYNVPEVDNIKIKSMSRWRCKINLMSKKELDNDNNLLHFGDYTLKYTFTNLQSNDRIVDDESLERIFQVEDEYYAEKKKRTIDLRNQNQQREISLNAEKKNILNKAKTEKEKLISLYGNRVTNLILNGKVEIGMSKIMCQESWGKPFNVNRTTTAKYVNEFWSYSAYGLGKSLYFENGLLVKFTE